MPSMDRRGAAFLLYLQSSDGDGTLRGMTLLKHWVDHIELKCCLAVCVRMDKALGPWKGGMRTALIESSCVEVQVLPIVIKSLNHNVS